MSKLQLSKPFLYDGKEITEIEYDFEQVKPQQFKAIIRKLQKQGITCAVPELDPNFQEEFFALASGIPAVELSRLPIRDYKSLCSEVRSFFLVDSEIVNPMEE